jgi:hypothetical protein
MFDPSIDRKLLPNHCALTSIVHSLCSLVRDEVGFILNLQHRKLNQIFVLFELQFYDFFRVLADHVQTDPLQGLVATVLDGRGVLSMCSEYFRFQCAKNMYVFYILFDTFHNHFICNDVNRILSIKANESR